MSLCGEQANKLKWPRVVTKRGYMMTVMTRWSWHRWQIQAHTQYVHTRQERGPQFALVYPFELQTHRVDLITLLVNGVPSLIGTFSSLACDGLMMDRLTTD